MSRKIHVRSRRPRRSDHLLPNGKLTITVTSVRVSLGDLASHGVIHVVELETDGETAGSWDESLTSTHDVSTYLLGVQAGMAMLGVYLTGIPSIPE